MKIIASTLIALLVVTPSAPDASHDEPIASMSASPSTAVTGSDGIQDDMVTWALGRYERAGLGLPTLVVEFADGRDACGGNTAVAVHGGTPRIVMCTRGADTPDVVVKRTLLHEIAHIWARESIDTTTRQAFLALRGLASWDDAASWAERGSEQAAEIVTWALMDRELTMLTIPGHDRAQLAEGYELLTGTRVPTR